MKWYQWLFLQVAGIIAYYGFGYTNGDWQKGEDYAWGGFCATNLAWMISSTDFEKKEEKEKKNET